MPEYSASNSPLHARAVDYTTRSMMQRKGSKGSLGSPSPVTGGSRASGINSTSQSPVSAHPVLPPIITNEADRLFLQELNMFISHEMNKVDPNNAEQRYTVHKAAFDRVIEHVTAYKPLLTAVKAEYEECIDTILRGKREAAFLSGKLRAMASEPSTRRNYRKRADELEHRLSIVKEDNERLAKQLQNLREARLERDKQERVMTNQTPKNAVKKERQRVPGLTTEQATDIKYLSKELAKLEQQAKELEIAQKTKYTGKETKESLREQLSDKVSRRDELEQRGIMLKAKRQRLRTALDAAQHYLKFQPLHQTVGDAVMVALAQNKGDRGVSHTLVRDTPSTSFDDDDPTREKEAEMMLEYIEKFNELFEEGSYEEAAIHAANSPKGILRTLETLNRFKDLKTKVGGRSPLLAFCDALMSSVLAMGVRPSETISLECVRCALEENRFDLLSHWVTQERLTVTEELGSLITEQCSGKSKNHLALAESVFTKVGAHRPAVEVMLQQGRTQAALEYAQSVAHFKEEDYLFLLKRNPTVTVAQLLAQLRPLRPGTSSSDSEPEEKDENLSRSSLEQFQALYTSPLPLGLIVSTLRDEGREDVARLVLQNILNQDTSTGEGPENTAIRKSVFADDQTSPEQWLAIINDLQKGGHEEVALEILAAVTVLGAMKRAVSVTSSSQGRPSTTHTEKQSGQ
ncbi:clathrin heavy chain linker domain-containing protein 1 [Lingula anatina]|uniref:Clathrin heavy chain linker domain-containing protein 1 n=1 Tax=Lingula anatina TaxID=7574 RepID=A0A1S3HE44_LINAN|nr:clathrin heavy chain linker domain-containing protein 1 [Lingula anatina]|eukprot:XP_013383339.1 clathrin heavy chain linker domain-containing protein 1 [Lingula anatina]